MSRYALDKFLYLVDGNPDLLAAYVRDAAATVAHFEAELVGGSRGVERTTWLRLSDVERAALVAYDWVAVSELGAHPYLAFQLFRAVFGSSYAEPLGFERAYARSLAHWSYPYPDHAT
jgi:hypothetical protein